MAPSTTTSFTLRSILEKDKLNGTNYTDWIHNLRIVLRAEKKKDVLDAHYQKSLLMMQLLLSRMLIRKHATTILK
jgi:hypothetical protein